MSFQPIIKNQKKYFTDQAGQSLLEITVSVGLILVIVTGLMLSTINGLKNSQFAQNQTLATKLAQEGIEKVRSIKDQDCPIFINGTQPYYWYDKNPKIWNFSIPLQRKFRIPPSSCSLTEISVTDTTEEIQGKFLRSIYIQDDSSVDIKKVTSEVIWIDYSGNHSSKLTTFLTN